MLKYKPIFYYLDKQSYYERILSWPYIIDPLAVQEFDKAKKNFVYAPDISKPNVYGILNVIKLKESDFLMGDTSHNTLDEFVSSTAIRPTTVIPAATMNTFKELNRLASTRKRPPPTNPRGPSAKAFNPTPPLSNSISNLFKGDTTNSGMPISQDKSNSNRRPAPNNVLPISQQGNLWPGSYESSMPSTSGAAAKQQVPPPITESGECNPQNNNNELMETEDVNTTTEDVTMNAKEIKDRFVQAEKDIFEPNLSKINNDILDERNTVKVESGKPWLFKYTDKQKNIVSQFLSDEYKTILDIVIAKDVLQLPNNPPSNILESFLYLHVNALQSQTQLHSLFRSRFLPFFGQEVISSNMEWNTYKPYQIERIVKLMNLIYFEGSYAPTPGKREKSVKESVLLFRGKEYKYSLDAMVSPRVATLTPITNDYYAPLNGQVIGIYTIHFSV